MVEAEKDKQEEEPKPAKKAKRAKKGKKAKEPTPPQKYSVVINPVRPTTEVVEGEEELIELLKQHAEMLGIPESEIQECGLFSIFKGEEVKVQCQGIKIELSS